MHDSSKAHDVFFRPAENNAPLRRKMVSMMSAVSLLVLLTGCQPKLHVTRDAVAPETAVRLLEQGVRAMTSGRGCIRGGDAISHDEMKHALANRDYTIVRYSHEEHRGEQTHWFAMKQVRGDLLMSATIVAKGASCLEYRFTIIVE
ncbi:hypothetical protein ACQQ2N_08205 [Dokdonella sp. MW10]|uniref:hypothetical protein n=1 Tax=Dokdonella sp. MW10 TaxID=2992926 RepID=UPI003F7F8FDB